MSTMAYCRWENTHADLVNCLESMMEVKTKDLSEREKMFKRGILKLFYENADEYRLFIEEETEEEENKEE